MRRSSFVLLMLLSVGGCNGCPSTSTTNNGTNGLEDRPEAAPRPRDEDPAEKYAKRQPRKTTVNGQPTHLSPGESGSLRQALAGKPAARTQLRAEVVNGQLVFRSDDDAPHPANSNLSMVVHAEDGGDSRTTVKVVATPEAARILLDNRGR